MSSFLENPLVHAAACQDPELVSGPFINIAPERQEEVRELFERTKERQAQNINLATAFMQFAKRLTAEAKGICLEPFYAEIPELLRGYAELVYDYFDRPSVRIMESLLYQSSFYDVSLQSFGIRRLREDRQRPFIVNTPRLRDRHEIEWNLPFESGQVDELFKLDTEPQSLSHIVDTLGATTTDFKILEPFLSEELNPKLSVWRDKKIRIRNFGHASVFVEWNGVSILTDACIPVTPIQGGLPRLSFCDLPERIDFVVITHNHHDHYDFESLLRIRHRVQCLVVPRSYGILYGDLSLKLLSQKLGFRHVIELDTLETVEFPGGEIVGVPFFGEHADLSLGKMAYVVRCDKEKILFAADSDCLDPRVYEQVRKSIGPVQTVFLSTEGRGAPLSWVTGPLLPQPPRPEIDRQRRYHACDARRALMLLEALGSKRVYVYAMGLEPWAEHLLGSLTTEDSDRWKESDDLLSFSRGRGFVSAERLFGKTTIYLNGSTSISSVPNGERTDDESRRAYWERRFTGAKHLDVENGATTSLSEGAHVIVKHLQLPSRSVASSKLVFDDGANILAVSLIAAFLCGLSRLAGHEDFTVVASFDRARICEKHDSKRSGTIKVTLRLDISGNPTFKQLLKRIQDVILGAIAHELDASRMLSLIREVSRVTDLHHVTIGFVLDPLLESQLDESVIGPKNEFEARHIELRVTRGEDEFIGASLRYSSLGVDQSVSEQVAKSVSTFLSIGFEAPDQHLNDLIRTLQDEQITELGDNEAQFRF
jgi:L-ascorbate metabolism protein UlaG (beta-lactamase superfamily)